MSHELPSRAFTPLPPPPAGALDAVHGGRGIRRRRRITGAGAAAASLVLLAGVVAANGTGSNHAEDQLIPARKPTSAALPTPASAVAPPGTSPVTGPGNTQAVPPGSAGAGGAVASTGPAPATRAEGDKAANRTSPTGYRTPTLRRTYRPAPPPSPSTQQGPGGRLCGASYNDSQNQTALTTDWCLTPIATASTRGHDLTVEVCRDTTGPGRLTFSRQQEVDLTVTSGNRIVWQWSRDQPNAAGKHTLDAAADGCWSWTAPWTDVDAGGRRLAGGSYTLIVTSSAAELQALGPKRTTFSIA
jgi:hypothetical protein